MKHSATIEIRIAKVNIIKPKTLKKHDKYPALIGLYVIEAKEAENTVPNGEKPLHWSLLTTHDIDAFEMAVMAVY